MTPAATFSTDMARVAPDVRTSSLRRLLCLASRLAILILPSVAHAQSHTDQLQTYARTLSTTTFAEQSCTGFRASAPRLALMRMQARITDVDDGATADRVRESTASATAAYERAGKEAWCADTYRQFGPDGSLVKGALEKKP